MAAFSPLYIEDPNSPSTTMTLSVIMSVLCPFSVHPCFLSVIAFLAFLSFQPSFLISFLGLKCLYT